MMRGSVTLLGRIWLSTMRLRAAANAWAAWSMAGSRRDGNVRAYREAVRVAPCGCAAGLDQAGRQTRYTEAAFRSVRWQSGDAADCKSANVGSIPARTSSVPAEPNHDVCVAPDCGRTSLAGSPECDRRRRLPMTGREQSTMALG